LGQVVKTKPEFGRTHSQGFTIYIRQGVFPVGTEAFGDVVLVPGEDADGLADRNQLEAQFHLAAEPDMVAYHAVLNGIMAAFPNLTAKEEGATLDGHVPVRFDRAGNEASSTAMHAI